MIWFKDCCFATCGDASHFGCEFSVEFSCNAFCWQAVNLFMVYYFLKCSNPLNRPFSQPFTRKRSRILVCHIGSKFADTGTWVEIYPIWDLVKDIQMDIIVHLVFYSKKPESFKRFCWRRRKGNNLQCVQDHQILAS